MKFYKYKETEPTLILEMVSELTSKLKSLNIKEAEICITVKAKLNDEIKTEEIREIDGVKYAKLFFP